MKALISLFIVSFLISIKLLAGVVTIQEASCTSAAQIQTEIAKAVSQGNTDIILQFADGGTWGTSASGGDIILAVPAGVTKLTFYAPSTVTTKPVLYINTLTYSDALMVGGITFDGVRLIAGAENRFLVSSASNTNFPASVTIQNCCVEGYSGVFVLGNFTNTVSNVKYTNSTFKCIGVNGIISTGAADNFVNDINITNNTFIDCNNVESSYFIDHRTNNPESTTLNFSDNVYFSAKQGNSFIRLSTAPTTDGHYTFNNNNFSAGTGQTFQFGYERYSNFSGRDNYFSSSFTSITTPNSVSFTSCSTIPTIFNTQGTNFPLNDVNFAGKVSSEKIIKTQKKAERLEWLKTVGLYSASIIINGIGDGLNDSHQKTMGHVCNAASIGLLLASPFLLKYNKKNWIWYVASYTSLRVGLFDAAYNLTRKLPLNFVGSTSATDKIYKAVGINPSLVKSSFLGIAISIPLMVL